MRIAGIEANAGPVRAGTHEPVASPKLERAAHQFEAALLGELLKPLREPSAFSDKSGDDDDSGSQGSMRSYGTEAVAQALSERGGVGIARLVMQRLAPLQADQTGMLEQEK